MAERRLDPTNPPEAKKTYTREQFVEFYGNSYGRKMWKEAGALTRGAAKKAAGKKTPRTRERRALQEGDKIPSVEVDVGFGEFEDVAPLFAGKKSVLIGLPGAFTKTWSEKQVPSYLAKQEELKAKGVAQVIVCSVNDGAVMQAWAQDRKVGGSIVRFVADPQGKLTRKLGMRLTAKPAVQKLGNVRCKRFAAIVDDGVAKHVAVSETPDTVELSCADAILEKL